MISKKPIVLEYCYRVLTLLSNLQTKKDSQRPVASETYLTDKDPAFQEKLKETWGQGFAGTGGPEPLASQMSRRLSRTKKNHKEYW